MYVHICIYVYKKLKYFNEPLSRVSFRCQIRVENKFYSFLVQRNFIWIYIFSCCRAYTVGTYYTFFFLVVTYAIRESEKPARFFHHIQYLNLENVYLLYVNSRVLCERTHTQRFWVCGGIKMRGIYLIFIFICRAKEDAQNEKW